MSIEATYKDGVFKPVEDVRDAVPGKTYRIFSEEELRGLTEDMRWLKLAEKSFDFWDNDADAVYDRL
jgi:predicted DNA-binding antitoxin AbrB/MazE fold protein